MTYLNDKFNDLPILKFKPVMTDEDIEFVNDMDYFKRLLTVIVEQAAQGGHRSPWPDDLSYHSAWVKQQVAHEFSRIDEQFAAVSRMVADV